MNFTDNLWNESPQSWNAYGLTWHFTYSDLTAKRTITAPGFKLDIKVTDITKFPSPHLWWSAWAKKNKNRLPSQNSEAVTLELELFPSPEPRPEVVQAEVVTDELTEEEESGSEALLQAVRLYLERKVERAFYEAGRALRELRDRRLYRSTHKSFEDYVQDRFGMKRAHSYRLIEAALVVDNLEAKCLPLGYKPESPPTQPMSPIGIQKSLGDDGVTSGRQILPTSERLVRPLIFGLLYTALALPNFSGKAMHQFESLSTRKFSILSHIRWMKC